MNLKDNWLQGLLMLLLSLIAQNVMMSIYYNRDKTDKSATIDYVNTKNAEQDKRIEEKVDRETFKVFVENFNHTQKQIDEIHAYLLNKK